MKQMVAMTMIPLLPESCLFLLPPCLPGLSLPGYVFQDLLGFLPPGNQRSQSMSPLPPPHWLPTTLSSLNSSVMFLISPFQPKPGREGSCPPPSGSPGNQQSWKFTQENRQD